MIMNTINWDLTVFQHDEVISCLWILRTRAICDAFGIWKDDPQNPTSWRLLLF